MGQQPSKSVEDKTRIVPAVLRGDITIAEAARREGASSVSKWRDHFLAGGRQALEAGARYGISGREQQMAAEIEELNTALGEAHIELQLWKGGLAAWGFDGPEAHQRAANMTETSFCDLNRPPLRSHQIRAPLLSRHRQRRRTRRRGRLVPHDLQLDPTPRGHRHGPPPKALPPDPDHPTARPRIRLKFLTRDTEHHHSRQSSDDTLP